MQDLLIQEMRKKDQIGVFHELLLIESKVGTVVSLPLLDYEIPFSLESTTGAIS